MVLTTVPTTALTVHAETDGDNTEIVAETEIDPSDLDENQDENAPDDSNSELSDEEKAAAAEAEAAKKAEEEAAKKAAEEEAAKKAAEEEAAKKPADPADGEAEPADPSAEEATDPEKSVAEAEQTTMSNETYAAIVSESAVVTEDIQNKDDADTTTATENAQIFYMGGCVSDKKVVENRDLVFRVEPKDGRVLDKVSYKIGDGESAATVDKTSEAKSGNVTILKGDIFTTADGVTTGKPVTITVVTKPVVYTVALDNSGDSTNSGKYDLYAVTGTGDSSKLAAEAYDAAKKPTVEYGKSLQFALVPKADQAVKPSSIQLNSKDITFEKKELEQEAAAPAGRADAETKTAYVFTVDTSKAEYGLAQHADAEATVTVAARALNQLTVTMTAADNSEYEYAASVANTAAANYINYDEDGNPKGFAKIDEESTDLEKSLAFMVKPTAGNLITGVTAKVAGTTGDPKDVVVTTTDVQDSNNKECTIALNQTNLDLAAGALTLTVKVETGLDKTTGGVTEITFAGVETGDLAHVEYKAADEKAGLEAAESGKNNILVKDATSDDYYIQVSPKTGYELAKSDENTVGADGAKIGKDKQIVTIKETRKVTGETDPVSVSYAAEAYVAAVGENEAEVKPIQLTLKAAENGEEKAYTVTAVEVTIGTAPAENKDEKKVTFSGDLLDSVTIKNTAGVVLIAEDETIPSRTYAIAEGVNLFQFDVASDAVPAVQLNGADLTGTAAEGGNSFSYSVPTAALEDDVNGITVNEGDVDTKTVTVKVVNENLSADVEDGCQYMIGDEAAVLTASESGNENEYKLVGKTSSSSPAVGSAVSMKLVAATGVVFGDVTYTVKGGEAQTATVSADKKTATVEFTVTDNVEVTVETKTELRVVLSGTGVDSVEDTEGAYTANYDVTGITAKLIEGVNTEANIYDVVVLDGTTTAATTATVSGKAATISKIEEADRGTTLTIRVYKTSREYADATLAVSGTSTGVSVKMDGKEVPEAGVTMPSDSEAVLEVSAEGTAANTKDLKAAIVFEKNGDAAVTGKATDFFGDVDANGTIAINEGKIVLKAKPAKAAPTDKVSLVISSTTVKDDTDQTKDKEFKKIPLNVTGPLVTSDEIKEVKAAAASSSNREVRLNLDLEFKDMKKLPKAPLAGDLYYKVEVTKVEGDAEIQTAVTAKTLELKTKEELTRFVKIEKSNGSYNKADLAKFVEFNLVKSFKDAEGNVVTGDLPGIITAEAKVTLVQSLGTSLIPASTADDYVAVADDKVKTVTEGLATSAPIYETKLTVKLVNGAAVFTGQSNVTVATPSFSKDTTCDEITVQFVDTKTGLLRNANSVGSKKTNASYSGFTAGVNEDNSIWVSSAYGSTNAKDYKDLGVKVTAHAENDEYRASAVVKLKVQQGIYSIETDESKAALPETLYSDNKGAVKSVKIATTLNSGDRDTKPAKSNLTWEITDSSGKSINDAGCALPANIKKALTAVGKNGKPAPTITVKNGTVSVAKGYEYDTKNPGGNTFYVNAKAADFAGNTTTLLNSGYSVSFTISKEAQVIEKLAVVDESDAPAGEVSSDKNGVVVTLTAEEVIEDTLRVVALKNGAELVNGYYDSSDFLPATINISGKLVTLDKDGNASQPYLVFSKPGDKITVTAKVVDGSKAKDVKMTLNVKPFEQLGLRLHATNDAEYAPDTKDAISYSGSSNERYDLSLMYYSKEYEDWQDLSSYKNVKVKVDNGKFVANKEWAKDEEEGQVGSAVVVASGKDTATITLTDTGAKNAVKNTYTITTDVNTGNMKAPNIKMTAPKKLTAGYWGAIKWNVSDQDKQTKKYIYAGQYVKLAPDFTVAPLTDSDKKYLAGERDAYRMLDWDGEYYRIDENGEFETWFSSSGYANSHYLRPGTYKMVATIGTIDNGKFTPTTKDKKLSFSVPKWKTASTSLSVTGGYKLDVKSAAEAKILVKTGTSYKVFDAKNVIKKDQKLGDHSNNFTTYFEIKRKVWKDGSWVYSNENENEWIGNDRTYDGQSEYATIGLKPNLTVDQINYITDKAGKDDCTGYITVDNGYFRKDIKITIGFSELKKYTAKADPFFANSAKYAVNVKIYNGKTYVPVKYAAIDTGEKSKNDITPAELKVSVADGDILLERANGFEANKYTISLKVVPESVALIKENDAAVSALDEAKMLESYAIPAELKLEVKDLAKADKTLNTNLAVKLATYEYDEYRNGGYEFGVSGKYGKYRADVPYSLTADNMTVKDAVVTWENNAVAENLNLVEAAKGTTKVWNSSTDEYDTVQSINLKVNKEALEKALDKNNKPLYYGKTLTVPVEITYENSAKATAKETVNYKITVPKKPADTFDEAAVNSKLENLYVNIDDETPANTIDHLSGKIYDAVALLVPADTDYKITELKAVGKVGETEVTEAVDVVKTGKAAFSFKIVNNVKTTEAAKTFNFTYDLGIKPSEVGDEEVTLAGLKTEVSTKLEDGTVTYAKDKTAEAVMTDLTKADGSLVKKVLDDAQAGRKNYTIKAKVEHIAATKTSKASMKVTVEIRNLTNREKVGNEWLRLVTVTGTIDDKAGAALNDFDAAYTAVSGFFKENTNITGIVDDCSGQADDIWKAIETKAKELVNNPGITVTVENKNYVAPEADNAETSDVDESANGTISFTIKLVENGRVRNYKVAEIQIPKANATQYAPIATVETDITKAIITDDNTKPNEKLKGIANPEGKDAINDSDALKAAIETEIKKIVAAKPAESDISVVEDPAAKYSGYLYEIQEWAFSPASKKAVATLSFKLVITLKGNSSSTRTIPVSCDDLIGIKNEYQTLKELAAELADVTEFTVDAAPTADNYKATLKTKLRELDNANAKRTIELTEEGTFTAATETPKADAKVEGVKITVTEGEGEAAKTENVEMKTITFKVAAAQD